MLETLRRCLYGDMKTDFQLLWPWFHWRTKGKNVFKGIGFPTEISYHSYSKEWHFELQILGFGFYIERYPSNESVK